FLPSLTFFTVVILLLFILTKDRKSYARRRRLIRYGRGRVLRTREGQFRIALPRAEASSLRGGASGRSGGHNTVLSRLQEMGVRIR
ncbi:MAG: hypothetical protein QXY83_02835, partial [Thermosphaera sp.]